MKLSELFERHFKNRLVPTTKLYIMVFEYNDSVKSVEFNGHEKILTPADVGIYKKKDLICVIDHTLDMAQSKFVKSFNNDITFLQNDNILKIPLNNLNLRTWKKVE